MSTSTMLQIFLYADVFVIGFLAALTARHAKQHYKPETSLTVHDADKPRIPAAAKDRMVHASELRFQGVLNHSVDLLQHDLESTSEQINGLVKRFAGEIVGDEMERYRSELTKLHKQAETDMGSIKQAISGHQAEIEAKMAQELAAEKQRLISQIDTKLSDAVGSFLIETLQHNVDLGNQSDYLVALLEEHKAEFKQEVTGGQAEPSK